MKKIIIIFVQGIFLFSSFFLPLSKAQEVTLSYGEPGEVNINPEILDAGVSLFRKAVEEDNIRNVVLLVARNGKIVLHEAIGWKDKENGIPLKKDAMFRMASNTKPVIATGIKFQIQYIK